jgi:hypothetical protein
MVLQCIIVVSRYCSREDREPITQDCVAAMSRNAIRNTDLVFFDTTRQHGLVKCDNNNFIKILVLTSVTI